VTDRSANSIADDVRFRGGERETGLYWRCREAAALLTRFKTTAGLW